MNHLYIVGIGPGGLDDMTRRAYRLIEEADLIVGYTVYNDLLRKNFPKKEYYETPMRQEKERCIYALSQAAEGKKTVLVCSGDSGVYGMASLVLELAENRSLAAENKVGGGSAPENKMVEDPAAGDKMGGDSAAENKMDGGSAPGIESGRNLSVEIEVVPGVTAALSASALAGAPVSGDVALISLSDLLTPWNVIEKRLAAAAAGDFVIALYNPGSKKRTEHLRKACQIILKERSEETVCAIAQKIDREGENVKYLSLKELEGVQADMFTTIIIGNSSTKMVTLHDGTEKMVTPRGYRVTAAEIDETSKDGAGKEKRSELFFSEEERRLCGEHDKKNGEEILSDKKAETSGVFVLPENLQKLQRGVRRRREEERNLQQKRLLIFGGTTEGRMLAEYACGAEIPTLVCVATKYGEKVMAKHRLLEINSKGLNKSEICELLEENDFFCVFDATHPYAVEITEKISAACEITGQKYIRVLRDVSGDIENSCGLRREDDVIFVRSIDEAASLLNQYEGRALITTGSKEIQKYMSVQGAAERLVFRVLPSHEALDACQRAGISGKNLICMQGPFSVRANRAMLKEFHADFLVTKVSGKNGGFSEKIEAARLAQATVIAVTPPDDRSGISMQDALRCIDEIKTRRDV